MDLRLIKRIIKLVEESQINELEVEEGELRISVRKQGPVTVLSQGHLPSGMTLGPSHPTGGEPYAMSHPGEEGHAHSVAEAVPEVDTGVPIPSPMVGTFYRSAAPDAPPFIQVGSMVDEETVVCILEAMKVMNEIKAGVRGKVTEILVENGNPVEFGQPLFRVKP